MLSNAAEAEARTRRAGRPVGAATDRAAGAASQAPPGPGIDVAHLSIVMPVHNEKENLAPLFTEIAASFNDLPHEIVAVDDWSTDGSREELNRLSGRFPRLRVVELERRSGQSEALMAGCDAAIGELIITMDSDGQNDPADGRRLLGIQRRSPYATAVVGWRAKRVDGWWKRVQSRVANVSRNLITGDSVRDTGCSLRVVRRDALLRIARFDGMHRFIPTLLRLMGEDVMEVEVSHRRRLYGKSKYGMWGRLGVGIRDAWGVRWLVKRRMTHGPRNIATGPSIEV